MTDQPDPSNAAKLNDEALAIIARRRPDLAGKSLEEIRAILKEEAQPKPPPLNE